MWCSVADCWLLFLVPVLVLLDLHAAENLYERASFRKKLPNNFANVARLLLGLMRLKAFESY